MGSVTEVSRALEAEGALFETDPLFPSVTALVAGEPIQGSWWSHPQGRAIFATLEQLEQQSDALCVKLLSGKRTYLHRRHWDAFFALATAKASWQTKGLTASARSLLRKVEGAGQLRLDRLPRTGSDPKTLRKAGAELELRLLVYGESVHTDSGAHAKQLSSWSLLIDRLGFHQPLPSEARARARFEDLVTDWSARFGKLARLPW